MAHGYKYKFTAKTHEIESRFEMFLIQVQGNTFHTTLDLQYFKNVVCIEIQIYELKTKLNF
jgi:hypothetical protein